MYNLCTVIVGLINYSKGRSFQHGDSTAADELIAGTWTQGRELGHVTEKSKAAVPAVWNASMLF